MHGTGRGLERGAAEQLLAYIGWSYMYAFASHPPLLDLLIFLPLFLFMFSGGVSMVSGRKY